MTIPGSIDEARAWRAAAGAGVAVVAGTFDILHPGNLAALRHARAAAGRVFVLIEPDAATANCARGCPPRNPQGARAEVVGRLRDVDAVAVADGDAWPWVRALQPFVWVTRGGASPRGALAEALAQAASSVVPAAGPEACSTASIHEAIAGGHTPLSVPASLYPAVSSDDIGRVNGRAGRPLVTVNGCFDILHVGHVRFLEQARTFGQSMVVLTNDDASVARYKGPTRPVFPVGFRVAALMALRCVDGVVPFSGDDPLALIRQLRPDVHVKGGSYEAERVKQERELVESWGGRLVCTELVQGYSTTAYIERAGGVRGLADREAAGGCR